MVMGAASLISGKPPCCVVGPSEADAQSSNQSMCKWWSSVTLISMSTLHMSIIHWYQWLFRCQGVTVWICKGVNVMSCHSGTWSQDRLVHIILTGTSAPPIDRPSTNTWRVSAYWALCAWVGESGRFQVDVCFLWRFKVLRTMRGSQYLLVFV